MTVRIPTLLSDLLAALAMVGLAFISAAALPSLEPAPQDTAQNVKTLQLSATPPGSKSIS